MTTQSIIDIIFLLLKYAMISIYIIIGICLALIIFGFAHAFYDIIITGKGIL